MIFRLSEVQILWHPDSPGMRVVARRWFPWFRRSPFATLAEVGHYYDSMALFAVDRTR